jgi:son of sevenless
MDSEDEVSDTDLGALSSTSNSRSTTSLNTSFNTMSNGGSSAASHSSLHSQSTTEAASSARPRTPEPWIKKLSEEGTYFYYNPVDGSAQWTRPTAPAAPTTDTSRLFVDSSPRDLNPRLSVYSDSSDVQPFDYPQTRRNGREPGASPFETNGAANGNGQLELTSAEKIANTLQKSLEPPPVDRVTDLSTVATNAIHSVLDIIQAGISRRPDDYARLDEFVSYVVVTVRSLLYVAAVPTGHISSSVLPKGIRSEKPPPAQTVTLKPMQRRVTATLSRLVLSARALQYDSGSQVADTLSRIETDAEELERAIIAFVVEVERVNQNAGLPPSKKRLEGVFATNNLGLGLVGAGAGASWKGFGWVSLEGDNAPPGKVLGAEVVVDINSNLSALQDTIAELGQALRINNDLSGEYPSHQRFLFIKLLIVIKKTIQWNWSDKKFNNL